MADLSTNLPASCRRRPTRRKKSGVNPPAPNVTLFFTPQTEVVEVDPATGLRITQPNTVTPIEIEAFAIENNRRLPNQQVSYGADSNRTPLRGYITSDPALLQGLDVSERIPMELRDPVTGSVTRGDMDLTVTTTPYADELIDNEGIPFTGIFYRTGSGETPEFP